MSLKHTELKKPRQVQRFSSSIRRRSIRFVVLISALFQITGCSAWTGVNNSWKYNGSWNETMMGYRNRCSSSKAWHSRKHHFCNQKYLKEFAHGFKSGYENVADGGNGCTPAFPPREYWGWKYQSCEGQARVAAWFSGFPHGARAAEEDGIGHWTQIQTSSNIQQQYAQRGMLNQSYAGIYPIPESAVPNGARSSEFVRDYAADPTLGYPASLESEPIEITTIPSLIQQ
jgi:hypothetical protein